MEQEYSKDIEDLKKDVEDIKALLNEFTKFRDNTDSEKNEKDNDLKNVQPMKNMHPDPKLSSIMDRLCKVTDEEGWTGSITYLGVFASGGRQSNWIQNETNTDDLLKLIENNSATTVLQSIGNNDRLNLLLALLREPMTVAKLVEKCGFNSTGQVYHHLKPLIAADIVYEDEHEARGVYAVKPHRVQGIIMLLAGIADLVDIQHSQGNWSSTNEI